MIGQKRVVWGITIQTFPEHQISIEDLEKLRMEVDETADNCLLALQSRNETVESFLIRLHDYNISHVKNGFDWDKFERDNEHIKTFVNEVTHYPDWIDWELIKNGQHFFLKNAGAASLGLLYFSLIGGFSAPKITKVLDSTSYLTKNRERTWRRLNETMEMIVDCIDDDSSLKIGNKGWISTLRVRFLHSQIRLKLMKINHKTNLNKEMYSNDRKVSTVTAVEVNRKEIDNKLAKPVANRIIMLNGNHIKNGINNDDDNVVDISINKNENLSHNLNWDIKTYGLPINQEDMVATLLAFSVNIIYSIRKITHRSLSTELTFSNDELAYLHLWRYIGYLIGISELHNPCQSMKQSIANLVSITDHLMIPNERSKEITKHLLLSVSNRSPTNWSFYTHSEAARILLGEELSNALGIERSLKHRIYVNFIFLLLYILPKILSLFITYDNIFMTKVRSKLRYVVNHALLSKKSE